jgi:hypothetical protein
MKNELKKILNDYIKLMKNAEIELLNFEYEIINGFINKDIFILNNAYKNYLSDYLDNYFTLFSRIHNKKNNILEKEKMRKVKLYYRTIKFDKLIVKLYLNEIIESHYIKKILFVLVFDDIEYLQYKKQGININTFFECINIVEDLEEEEKKEIKKFWIYYI